MKEKNEYLQCVHCGCIYRTTIRCDDDDLYIKIKCPECGHKKSLRCGENPEDKYLYGDITLDERYYLYNTK